MRDFISDISAHHKDPSKIAQEGQKQQLPKRFYKQATVEAGDEGAFRVVLDGRPVKTPGRSDLAAPTPALAELIAAEWNAQGEVIDPFSMPVTRLVNTAIDGVSTDPQAVHEDILRFSSSDLLCYRAGEPHELVERQAERWDPVIDWAANQLGARFILIEGIMHQEQPREAISAFAVTLRKYDTPLALAALHSMTTLTGSAILALAHAEGVWTLDEVWALAHLDEDWTIEHWGEDAEAKARRDKRFEEMRAASQTLSALMASE